MFVVEAQGVKKLVPDGLVVDAAAPGQRHRLGVITTSNIGVASDLKRIRFNGKHTLRLIALLFIRYECRSFSKIIIIKIII